MNVDIYAETYMEPRRHVYKQSGWAGFPSKGGRKANWRPHHQSFPFLCLYPLSKKTFIILFKIFTWNLDTSNLVFPFLVNGWKSNRIKGTYIISLVRPFVHPFLTASFLKVLLRGLFRSIIYINFKFPWSKFRRAMVPWQAINLLLHIL